MPEMLEEQGTSVAPECWNLPEKTSYWACFGQNVEPPQKKWWQRERKVDPEPTWLVVNYTKEDAEANAAMPTDLWVWDGLPAREVSLSERMFQARRTGRAGIVVQSYINGRWTTVKKYPAHKPLPMEEAQNG